MALTMVHLLVADLWAQGRPEYLRSPEFYLGAVSPDAMHIRFRDDKSRKNEFHLYNWQSFHREPVLEYWRARHADFDIGFGVHVLTDCQWVPRYKQRLVGMLLPDGKLNIDIYYNDTFVTDFALLHNTARLQRALYMVEEAVAPDDHPLLTRGEFDAWRDMIVDAYHKECPRHDPVRFVTEAYVREFADDSIALIEDVYDEAFGNGGGIQG